jgi:hypothetical protein
VYIQCLYMSKELIDRKEQGRMIALTNRLVIGISDTVHMGSGLNRQYAHASIDFPNGR